VVSPSRGLAPSLPSSRLPSAWAVRAADPRATAGRCIRSMRRRESGATGLGEWRATWRGARTSERPKPLGALLGASHHCMTLLGSMAGSKPATTGILMLSAPGQYHTPDVAWTYGWLAPGGMGGGASAR
jgi:hypothetical protein